MTTDFGTDVYSVDDLDETRLLSGVALVAADALWILKTPQNSGVLQDDSPTYGFDLLEEIGKATTPAEMAALPDKIRNALKHDERIETVESTITRVDNGGPALAYDIQIRCTTAEGPFELVGLASDEKLDLAVKLLPGATT